MPLHFLSTSLPALLPVLGATVAAAQAPLAYGPPISIEDAKRVAAAALAEARKNNWNMAVAITDSGANLVYFEKMDDTQLGSIEVAVGKSRTAALFKRDTKVLQDAVASGGEGLRVLRLGSSTPIEGGVLLIQHGRIVGAIGLSGAASAQDGQCAKAGAAVLK